MTRLTLSAATTLAALFAAAPSASANPYGQLHWFVEQISSQAATVGAQAHATFDDCAYGPLIADDVFDELEDLNRRLARLCDAIATGPPTRGSLRRIERNARRVHRQAVELDAEIRDAIADLRRRELRRARHAFRQPLAYGVPVAPHRGGVNLSLAGGRVQLNFASTHPAARHLANHRFATRHVVGYPTIGYGAGLHQIAAPGWARQPQADALCAQSERLVRMTKQLVQIVCG